MVSMPCATSAATVASAVVLFLGIRPLLCVALLGICHPKMAPIGKHTLATQVNATKLPALSGLYRHWMAADGVRQRLVSPVQDFELLNWFQRADVATNPSYAN